MKAINIQEAKTHLSRLLAQVAEGETIVIGKAGAPLAVLSKWQPAAISRSGGGWKGKVGIAHDFDAPDLEIEALFTGSDHAFAHSSLRVAETPALNRL